MDGLNSPDYSTDEKVGEGDENQVQLNKRHDKSNGSFWQRGSSDIKNPVVAGFL
jgi:hypothetical protein